MRPSIILRLCLSAWVALVFVVAGALTAGAAQKSPTRNLPTTITSGNMEYDANGQTVVFIGKVHVKRTDFELWADKMTVYLDKSGRSGASGENSATGGMEAGDIDRIVAEKNVRMTSNDKEGMCNKAIYYAKEDKLVMEGSPVLRDQKKSTITGGTVVHYLSANRSQVLDGGGVTFYAPDRTEKLTPDFSGKDRQP